MAREKSTTIRLLLSLIFPTSGNATVFGKDVVAFGPEIKKEIGYLPSEVFYYDSMRVREFLEYSARFYQKDCTDRIESISERLKLDQSAKIEDLSYGNKKKVGIVQGLLHSPKLIVLDEPTGGLDPLVQQNFFELLREENRRGVTIFFSSHILSEVQRLCDRVAIIKDGEVVKIESMSSLKNSHYKRVTLTTLDDTREVDSRLSGISDLRIEGTVTTFMFTGDINELLKLVLGFAISDLSIDEPTLEEIFLHYYR